MRVYPADEPKAGPAKPRGRPRKRVPGSDAAVAVAAGPERRIEESKDVRKKSIQVSNTKAPVVVPVPRVGPRPDPVARPPPLNARVGPPLGLAASASAATGAANLANPVARLRDDDEHAAAGIENADTAFESPSKEGSSSKEEVTSPPPRRLAVSPPRRPFAAANENAPRSAAPPPANAPPADAPPPPLVSSPGEAHMPDLAASPHLSAAPLPHHPPHPNPHWIRPLWGVWYQVVVLGEPMRADSNRKALVQRMGRLAKRRGTSAAPRPHLG